MVRVVLGIIFFAHGAQKVLGWFCGDGLQGTVSDLTSIGLSRPIAYLVCFFEFLGESAWSSGSSPGPLPWRSPS